MKMNTKIAGGRGRPAAAIFTLFGWGLAWAALGPGVRASSPVEAARAIVVDQVPAQISLRTFSPDHPPAEMPPLAPLEAGLCEYQFSCETKFQLSSASVKHGKLPATVSAIKLTTRLQITIWTAEKTTEKVIAHEAAHRELAEAYYRDANLIARRLAEGVLGRKITLTLQNGQPDTKAALRDIQNELIATYLDETAQRCSFAQIRFDAITDHARNAVPEPEAIAQARKDEERHYAEK